jgi:hypothetical protein
MTTVLNVVVLVPRRPDHGQRDRLWDFVRPHWANLAPVFEGHHLDGPFNRSAAINAASRAAGDWEVAIIIDSDVIVAARQVAQAVSDTLRKGTPLLAYTQRTHIGEETTEKILAGEKVRWEQGREFVLRDSCSSANVIRRDLWDAVEGFDEGFIGWGWEDVAFKYATEALAGRRTSKIPGMCWHLFHPRTTEVANPNNPLQAANRKRHELYRQARLNPDAMRSLIAERETL